jgi:hypothetical protein
MRGLAEDGAMIANGHTFLVKEGGMKSVSDADVTFKRRMDPYWLMNPGKFALDEATKQASAGAALPSEGWKYKAA